VLKGILISVGIGLILGAVAMYLYLARPWDDTAKRIAAANAMAATADTGFIAAAADNQRALANARARLVDMASASNRIASFAEAEGRDLIAERQLNSKLESGLANLGNSATTSVERVGQITSLADQGIAIVRSLQAGAGVEGNGVSGTGGASSGR